MKILIYNLDEKKFLNNFFDVYESPESNKYLPRDKQEAPRVIGSNEYFEVLEDPEADFIIRNKIISKFYPVDVYKFGVKEISFTRYYSPDVFPEEHP